MTGGAADLPLRLRPEERRDLAKRLAERLGTRTAGGLSVLASAGEAGRVSLEGSAGDVKLRGVQEWVAGRQRDTIALGGLPGGLGLVLEVDAAAAEGSPAPVRLAFREGPAERRAEALAEAFRFCGERFGALTLKKEAHVRTPPLAPLDAEEAKKRLRGRWRPVDRGGDGGSEGELGPHLTHMAVALPVGAATELVLLREGADPARRSAVAIACIAEEAIVLGLEVARGLDARIVMKALTALAFDVTGGAPADPRPRAAKTQLEGEGAFETCGFVLGRPGRAEGELREASAGKGARLASLDLKVAAADASPLGPLCERHLLGLPGDGLAIVATAPSEGRTAITVAGPRAQAPKWLEKLRRAADGE